MPPECQREGERTAPAPSSRVCPCTSRVPAGQALENSDGTVPQAGASCFRDSLYRGKPPGSRPSLFSSFAFPRVKNLNPEAGEILDVAGRHGEAVLKGGCPDQAVNRRQRGAALLHPGRQHPPASGGGLRDGQQPSLKGAPQILFEPFFQGGPPLAGFAEFDALPGFGDGQHACEKETILGLRQPALDAGIGLTAPGELR